MNPTFSATALAWLLTYAIHSTVLLGLVWLAGRVRRLPPVAADVLWKVALFGGVITATLQQRLDVQPSSMLTLPSAAAVQSPHSNRIPSIPGDAQPPASASDQAANAVASTGSDAPTFKGPSPAPLTATSIAVIAWGAVAFLLALWYGGRRLVLVGRLGDRQLVRDDSLVEILDTLRRDVGHHGVVRLTSATTISSPVALGRREICVPLLAISELDRDQQRSMLAHELAHLTRRDPMWFDVASLFERVFFFQPLNRLARRELESAAEYLCDDWAMRKTGTGVHLARCLAKVAEWIQASPLGVPVAGMAEERSLLVSRIARLLEGGSAGPVRSRRGAAAVALLLLVAMIAIAPRVAGHGARIPAVEADTGDRSAPRLVAEAEKARIAAGSARGIGGAMSGRPHVPAESQQPADSTVVKALIARLKDDDADVRRAAARSLGRLEDPRAVPGLIEALKDPSQAVRAEAADALADFEDTRAIAPLAELLSDPSGDVKENALSALGHFEKGIPAGPITRLLGDSNAGVRQRAVHMLVHMGERGSAPAIARLIHDPSADVRSAVVSALGELGGPAAGPAIVSALGDSSADVRQEALQALDETKTAIPQATLLALLRDASGDVRRAAVEVAGRRSLVAAIPTLRQMLDDPKSDVRENVVEALGNIADPAARDALRGALNSKDPKVRRAAAEALGERP